MTSQHSCPQNHEGSHCFNLDWRGDHKHSELQTNQAIPVFWKLSDRINVSVWQGFGAEQETWTRGDAGIQREYTSAQLKSLESLAC